MIQLSWRESTRKVYSTYLNKWGTFCNENQVDALAPHPSDVTDFLVDLIDVGSKFKTVNIARCSLSAALPRNAEQTIGKDEMVGRVVRAANNVNPSAPRYTKFWDVSRLFNMFREWGDNSQLSLQKLTWKTTVLLLLLTAQRGQTIWRLNISGLEFREDHMSFKLKHLLKHNRPGDPLDSVVVPAYPREISVCPVTTVRAYVQKTQKIRKGADQLLLITVPPFTPAARDTISTWTKDTLKLAGIDTDYYKAHSTRGAVTSKAKVLGINMNILLKQASWKSEDTYGKYYNKTIERVEDSLAHTVLNNAQDKET